MTRSVIYYTIFVMASLSNFTHLIGTDQFSLQLLLYFEELEVCNPLKSKANKHKLGKTSDRLAATLLEVCYITVCSATTCSS